MQTSQPVKPYRSNTLWYILTISICIIIVSIGCYVFVKQQRFFLLKEKRKEIATIADIKMSQLVQWRNDRLADGASIRANVMMASRIKSNISNKSNIVTHNEFRLWMLSLIDLGEYSKGILFTPEGKVISSDSNFKRPLSDHYLQLVSEAAKSRKVILTDFHQDSDGATYDINLVIPIMNPEGSHPGCFAVIVFDINPDKRLYPLIQAWPTVSATAETLLVKREGNSVLFLNDLRFRKKTPTLYKHPLAPNTMPAVRAALGQTGDFEDIDYRKSRVLCTTRVIPDTTWGLVAKIDVNEVLSPLTKTIWMIIIAGFVAITAMTLGIFLWSSRRRSEALRKLFAIEQEHTDTLKKAEDSLTRLVEKQQQLLDIFPALIWKAGTDARCNYFNQTWLTFTGRTLEEELGDGWATGVHPEDLERCVTFYMESFQAQRPFEIEYRLRYNDGSYHWISDNGVPHHDLNNIFVGYIGCCYD
ncbi:MAG: PAS domain-containing protein, partial [Desulfuromonadales bacterium]